MNWLEKPWTGRILAPRDMPAEPAEQPPTQVETSAPARDRATPSTDPVVGARAPAMQRATVELNSLRPLNVASPASGATYNLDMTRYGASVVDAVKAVSAPYRSAAVLNLLALPEFDPEALGIDGAISATCGSFVPQAGDYVVKHRVFVRNATGQPGSISLLYGGRSTLSSLATRYADCEARWAVSTRLRPAAINGTIGVGRGAFGTIPLENHSNGMTHPPATSQPGGVLYSAAGDIARDSYARAAAGSSFAFTADTAMAVIDFDAVVRQGLRPLILATRLA